MTYPQQGEVILQTDDGLTHLEYDHVDPTEWGVRCQNLCETENGVQQTTQTLYYPWHRVHSVRRDLDND